MKRRIIITSDGSKTIHLEDWNEQYHSKHGAIQEAYHVFIEHGLKCFQNRHINLLEIGFGTGLNALISLIESKNLGLGINYVGVEAYPVLENEIRKLNYIDMLNASDFQEAFSSMHNSDWNKPIAVTSAFNLTKQRKDFSTISDVGLFNLIYFDAFGARVQPELWTVTIFQKMYTALDWNGILVTYSAKGSVRRAMQEVGFKVERLPGPPGKREMLRGVKSRLL
ncbi:tRNA (5-methylaminomethyl-2-thiouridine)(34)-methyltransferase MnmD [Croceitalea rosinachiae]|uniref:tRNA (5-methylaminomethyl-2-thiouridine)(34)-methyltransferase MnmD n=1 Tax=Croceitalea rosinachiae TaxID=3075596 RepID=A0ABU3ADD8_9FLAO|nr:tRNA (5-methylaminomethyl-2-thiouridine)(34)-methyltransferase MnmD [Croceitalea sp. F388]MDT0608198.1 tRNA (5-methylaminomethyl-2-thiouridine)(34)-methyltransferase MnmD [Croceitalea sp. F388]